MSEYEQLIEEIVKHGVVVKVDKVSDDNYIPCERKYVGAVVKLDFSEHGKVFEDKIAELEKEVVNYKQAFEDKCKDYDFTSELLNKFGAENESLKQRIAELENENKNLNIRIFQNEAYGDKKPTKINLNDRVKVKLTPLGAEIYYHQYDDVNKKIKENGGTELEPMMPQIDKDGFTEMQLWHFIKLYGKHIGMCKPNVIEPLDIVIAE